MDDNSRRVLVEYTGRLEDGTVFESSEESGPMDIIVGAGQVIKGIDETLAEMEVGETRTVTIPCEKAFGRYSEYNVQKRDLRYVPNADELPRWAADILHGPRRDRRSPPWCRKSRTGTCTSTSTTSSPGRRWSTT